MARAILNLSVSPEAAEALTSEAKRRGSKVSPVADAILREYFEEQKEGDESDRASSKKA